MKMKKNLSVILSLVLSAGIMAGLSGGVHAAAVVTASVVELDNTKIVMDCAVSANLMKDANWNFENEEFYWRLVNTIDNMGSAYYYVMSITDEKAHEGNFSLLLDGVGGWSNILIPFDVKKNTEYTFSMWVNGSPGLGGMQNTVYKIAQVSGEFPKIEPQEWFTGDVGLGAYDGKWHQIAMTVNSGDNDQLAIVIADGGGLLYFDEFRFFETASPNGNAATEPSNLQRVIEQVKKEQSSSASSAASSSTAASSSKNSSAASSNADSTEPLSNSGSEAAVQSGDASSTSTSTASEDSVAGESEAVSNSADSSGSSASGTDDKPGSAAPIIIAIIAVIALAGAGFWYFKFKK